MAEAAFFYNTTTQRPARPKPPKPPSQKITAKGGSARKTSLNDQPQPFIDEPTTRTSANTTRTSFSTKISSSGSSSRAPSVQSRGQGSSFDVDLDPARMNLTATPLSPLKRPQVPKSISSDRSLTKTTSGTSSAQSPTSAAARWSGGGQREGLQRSESHGRTASTSSSSVTGSSLFTTLTASEPPIADTLTEDPFMKRHGRRVLRDNTIPYPLPCDLHELHRQTLSTMLLVQVFGSPVCSPNFQSKPPKRVLEIACGTGYWSSLCHQHFARKGHSVSFTGIDIVPLAPDMSKDNTMRWRFVQHDLRQTPLPFRDEEFDLVMVKDVSLVTPTTGMQQNLMDEYLRVLHPGGSLEIWDGDHSVRMLLPHKVEVPSEDDSDSDDEEQEQAHITGTYVLDAQVPLASPQNQFLGDYNVWVTKALEERKLSAMPCTTIRPMLLQESEELIEIDCRRLAIPLGEVRWEREGVGGAITQDGSGAASPNEKGKGPERSDRRMLSTVQLALRRTALQTIVQKIESLEPLLMEASGKGQDEWDKWLGNMMNDLLRGNGTSYGECLEVGAWWARKKKSTKPRKKRGPGSILGPGSGSPASNSSKTSSEKVAEYRKITAAQPGHLAYNMMGG